MTSSNPVPTSKRRVTLRPAVLAFAALAVLAVVVGLNVGATLAERAGGTTHVQITRLSEDPFTPIDTIPAETVIRVIDGHVAKFRESGGYDELVLDGGQAQVMRDLLAHAGEWADSYALAGGMPEQRWILRLLGSHPRSIAIDNPLANRSLPESLYRLMLVMLRPTLEDGVAPAPVSPTSMRLHLEPVPPGTDIGAASVGSLPPQVDRTRAASAGGQILSGADLDAFDALVHARSRLSIGQNGMVVRLEDQSLDGLFWGIDWSAWMPASR
jgi:hypothetical protein